MQIINQFKNKRYIQMQSVHRKRYEYVFRSKMMWILQYEYEYLEHIELKCDLNTI